jgi:hypothetical protein
MAAFRFRNNKWQARIQRKGQRTIAKSFISKQDAEKWARSIEVELDKNTYINTNMRLKSTWRSPLLPSEIDSRIHQFTTSIL